MNSLSSLSTLGALGVGVTGPNGLNRRLGYMTDEELAEIDRKRLKDDQDRVRFHQLLEIGRCESDLDKIILRNVSEDIDINMPSYGFDTSILILSVVFAVVAIFVDGYGRIALIALAGLAFVSSMFAFKFTHKETQVLDAAKNLIDNFDSNRKNSQ